MTTPRKQKRSLFTRENILMGVGILIVLAEFVNAEVLGHTFHYEFLLLGGAFCGVGIAQLGDRK
jgi:hypothetical protein